MESARSDASIARNEYARHATQYRNDVPDLWKLVHCWSARVVTADAMNSTR